MKRGFTQLFLVALALALLWPAASSASLPNNSSDTYQLFMDVPNVSQDAAGDTLGVTGHGTWSVHPKSAAVSGGYAFTFHRRRYASVRRTRRRDEESGSDGGSIRECTHHRIEIRLLS